jgi:fucose permease
MGAFSLGLSAKIVMRFGVKRPLALGMVLVAVGLLLFARAPVGGNLAFDVLPAMLVLGVGVGLAFNPVLLAATSDVDITESGLASGVANTGFMMGGALGLAVLASIAASRTQALQHTQSFRPTAQSAAAALNGGYHLAFVVGAVFAALAAVVATLLRSAAAAPVETAELERECVLDGV